MSWRRAPPGQPAPRGPAACRRSASRSASRAASGARRRGRRAELGVAADRLGDRGGDLREAVGHQVVARLDDGGLGRRGAAGAWACARTSPAREGEQQGERGRRPPKRSRATDLRIGSPRFGVVRDATQQRGPWRGRGAGRGRGRARPPRPRHPADLVQLRELRARRGRSAGATHQVAQVEVLVRRLVAARRDVVHVDVERAAARVGCSARPAMPLSSSASRSATSSPVVSPGSPWPPGCSQRSSLRWWSSSTREPSAETVIALPVRWPSRIARSNGRSWRRTKARIWSRSRASSASAGT